MVITQDLPFLGKSAGMLADTARAGRHCGKENRNPPQFPPVEILNGMGVHRLSEVCLDERFLSGMDNV